MLSYIKFLYKDKAYCSILHESYLMDKFPNSNAIPVSDIVTSQSIRSCFTSPVPFNKMPLVDVELIAYEDGYFTLMGTVEVA